MALVDCQITHITAHHDLIQERCRGKVSLDVRPPWKVARMSLIADVAPRRIRASVAKGHPAEAGKFPCRGRRLLGDMSALRPSVHRSRSAEPGARWHPSFGAVWQHIDGMRATTDRASP